MTSAFELSEASMRKEKIRPASDLSRPVLSRRRTWLFRVTSLVGVPLLFLSILELGLRLTGHYYPTAFLMSTIVDGNEVFVQNDCFGWQFFGPALARKPYPLRISKSKPANTVRIFVFGESAAFGDPNADFSLPRFLEAILSERYPQTRFEVINAAMTAVNSHAIVGIARDCGQVESDIWVVYMGNNEVVGPFGAGTVFGTKAANRRFVRAHLATKSTAIGQLLVMITNAFAPSGQGIDQWSGMQMFLENQVRKEDPMMQKVYGSFQQNLEEIVELGRNNGAKLALCTVASNLLDCAPFASLHRVDLSDTELSQWENLYQSGVKAQEAGKYEEAIQCFVLADKIDNSFAELDFRWASCLMETGQIGQARQHFQAARDEDALRFRADTKLNDVVRQVTKKAQSKNVVLVDVEKTLGAESPHRIPGNDLFFEHVHFNLEGNYRLSRTIAEQIVPLLPKSVSSDAVANNGWPSLEACKIRLGWTDVNDYQSKAEMLTRTSLPPFTSQCNHAEQRENLLKEIRDLLPRTGLSGGHRAVETCQHAVDRYPEDWVLRKNLASLRLATDDYSHAEEACRDVAESMPHWSIAWHALGTVLARQNRDTEAITSLERALRLDPWSEQIQLDLAGLYVDKHQPEKAIDCVNRLLAQRPNSKMANWAIGMLLQSQGNKNDAQRHFKTAIQRPSSDPNVLRNLALVCCKKGWLKESAAIFEQALAINPTDVDSLLGLATTRCAQQQHKDAERLCQQALQLDPTSAQAYLIFGFVVGQQGNDQDARKHFSAAVRLQPNLVSARINLGLALMKQGQNRAAVKEFEEVLRQSPQNRVALQNLRVLGGSPAN